MTIAWAENIKNITINKEISDTELNAINSLDLKIFKEDWAGTAEDIKTVLKNAEITVDGVKDPMRLVDIAEQFDQYVTKGDSWKLKLKDENDTNNPEWIKNIVNEPKNNDLAFFVQKLAWLMAYQTATAYTDTELTATAVSIDKTFGNQTKRALVWLKSWIENEEDYKNITEWKTYTGKYLDKIYIEWAISTKEKEIDKTIVLAKYNLQYADGEIQPKDGYEFIDPYSNNLAVKVIGDLVQKNGIIIDDIYTLTNITDLPDMRGEWTKGNVKVYEIKHIYNKIKSTFRFFGDGSVAIIETDEVVPRSKFIEKSSNNKREWKENQIKIEWQNNEKKFEYHMYNNLINTISDIKTSEFVSKYISEYKNIKSCFGSNSSFVLENNNPYFGISYRNYRGNNAANSSILLRDCVDAKGNFEKNKFFEKLLLSMKPTLLAMEQKEKNDNILMIVRGKTYTQQDLFGNKYDWNNYFSSYFELFSWNKVEIDAKLRYTYISDDNTLHFVLDDNGLDEKFSKRYVAIKDITDDKGNYDEDKFKAMIARTIEKIIEENY